MSIKLPKEKPNDVFIGVDLAIKEKTTNDYTAIVSGKIYIIDHRKFLFIDKIVNRRMSFPESIQTLRMMNEEYESDGITPTFLIEDAGLQEAWAQQLQEYGVNAKAVKLSGRSKEMRLQLTSNWVKEKRIVFPKTGAGLLIEQLVGFGVEKHDDLADAFSLLAIEVLSVPPQATPEVFVLEILR
jgi:predicted phage terminase large subunit-like protein